MDISTVLKDLSPLLLILLISCLKSRKGKAPQSAPPTIAATQPPPPLLESQTHETTLPHTFIENSQGEPITISRHPTQKKRFIKHMIIGQTILDPPLSLKGSSPFFKKSQ